MKDRNTITEELTSLLEKLTLQTGRILEAPDPGDLDIDVARQYLRELYDLFGSMNQEEVNVSADSEPYQEPVPEEVVEATPAPVIPDSQPVVRTEPEPVQEEPALVEEEPAPEPEPVQPPPAATIDSKGEKKSLYNLFSQQDEDKSVGAKLKRSKVDDLRKAIGINEKFIFSKELFGGNINTYETVVGQLNAAASLRDAYSVLETYRDEGNWADDSEALRMFVDFIEKRHA